jgi:hypothetical protein
MGSSGRSEDERGGVEGTSISEEVRKEFIFCGERREGATSFVDDKGKKRERGSLSRKSRKMLPPFCFFLFPALLGTATGRE